MIPDNPRGLGVVVWRVRIGDSDVWASCDSERDADFYGKQSGLRYEKQPLVLATDYTTLLNEIAELKGKVNGEYQRGFDAGYEQRHLEVLGALV